GGVAGRRHAAGPAWHRDLGPGEAGAGRAMSQGQKHDQKHDWKLSGSCPTSVELVRSLRRGATVADVGCHGWLLGEASLAAGVRYAGIDRVEPPGRPGHAHFVRCSDASLE